MKIFTTIKDSISNPVFYATHKHGSMKQAFAYFFELKVLQAICIAVLFLILVAPEVARITSTESINGMVQFYPRELTVTVKDGHASTNVEEPYMIPLPASFKSQPRGTMSTHIPANLVVIDTQTPFSVELFQKSDTLVLLTRDYFVGQKKDGSITISPLKTMPNMVINRTQIATWVGNIQPYFVFIIPIATVLIFLVAFVFGLIAHLFVVLILSLVILVIQKIRHVHFTYSEIFRLGLYTITVLVLLNLLTTLLGIHAPWYFSTALYLLIFFANTKDIKK